MLKSENLELYRKNALLIFGLSGFIVLTALVTDFFYQDIPKTIRGFFHLYSINPTHYILLSLLIIEPVIIYFLTKPIITQSKQQKKVIENQSSKARNVQSFIEKLIHDETDLKFEADEDDDLGKTLINLQNSLKQNKETEIQRRKEDEQRNWSAEGLAKFSEILRNNNNNLELLSYNVISEIVEYVDANQGGIFILHDEEGEEKHFQLTGSYAYERKKYADKEVKWGEGLIGSAALERQTIHLTDVPNSYVEITSGLGQANPRSLLIVPLIVNEELHGIIELASFNNFEKYQIEFIEKVGESIASTIATVKINVKTSKLLEESQEQAEILAAQEEQMRQNMEELQATQEEASRQSEKFISFTNSVNHTLIRAEYDTDGTLLYANTKFLKKLQYESNNEVEGQHISLFINKKDTDWFFKIWENLAKGGKHFEGDMKHVTKLGQDLWTMATYTCVRREDGSVEKILFLAIDTTEKKKQSLIYEGQILALDSSNIKVNFDTTGNIIDCNELFINTLKFSKAELKNKTIFELFEHENLDAFTSNWDKVTKGKPFQGEYKILTKKREEKWLRAFFSPVYDMYEEVSNIILISYDMTNEKLMEIERSTQNEQLKQQEEQLRLAGIDLTNKLEQAKAEVRQQFSEIEKMKIRTERTLEGALDAIITVNQFGKIEFFNKAAEELWELDRVSVLNKGAHILFSETNVKEDEFIYKLVTPNEEKIVGRRQEIKITTKSGNDVPVLCLVSEAKVDKDLTYTAFIQNIEVELF